MANFGQKIFKKSVLEEKCGYHTNLGVIESF